MEMTPVGMLSRMASVKRRRSVELAAAGFQLLRHLVEAAHQQRQLIDRAHFHAVLQVALAHLAGGIEQRGDGHADLLGQEQRHPGGDEEHEQRDEDHHHGVEALGIAQAVAHGNPFAVVAVR